MRFSSLKSCSVQVLFTYGCPFQILNPVVRFDLVNVVNSRFVVWIWYECLCNKTVYTDGFVFSVYRKNNVEISIG